MAALSLFPAISDDFSAEFFVAIAVILADKIQLTQFPSFFDRLNRTSFSHRPQAAADKVALIPTFHAVECDREMAFDVCLIPALVAVPIGWSKTSLHCPLTISTPGFISEAFGLTNVPTIYWSVVKFI